MKKRGSCFIFLAAAVIGLLIFLSIVSSVSSALEINEVSYDPSASLGGQYNEWIELWNDGSEEVNLSGCFLDKSQLPSLALQPYEFVVISRKPELFRNFSAFNGTIIPLSLSLSNSGDIIIMNGTCAAQLNYSSSFGAAKNNKTLERRADRTWGESLHDGGSPGKQNSIWEPPAAPPASDFIQLVITEILPNPAGADDALLPLGEWIELYNNGSGEVDLRGFFFSDSSGGRVYISDTNTQGENGTALCRGCYLLVYRNGDSDFSLDNEYDEITLYDEDKDFLTSVSYSGGKEGFSWQRYGSLWSLNLPTPFAPSDVSSFSNHSFNSSENVSSSAVCDISLAINGNYLVQESHLSFTVKALNTPARAQNVTVRGVIKKATNEIVKEYAPWNNQKIVSSLQKEYSPQLPDGVYLVTFFLENATCADNNLENNQVQQLFLKNNASSPSENSTFSIESVSLGADKKARWGDLLSLRLSIYKGNETKNEVRLWAEQGGKKVSKQTSFLLTEKNHFSTLTVPLQLYSNCEQEYSSGEVKLVLEGFGQQVEKNILVEGLSDDFCKVITASPAANPTGAAKENSHASGKTTSKSKAKSKTKSNDDSSRSSRAAAITLSGLPPSAPAGEVLRLTAHLKGAASSSAPFSYNLFGYVYKGRKCYSCFNQSQEPGAEAKSFSLDSGEEKELDLLLKIDPSLGEGTYKIKAVFQQEGLKNPKEATAEVYITPSATSITSATSSTAILSTLNTSSPPLLLASSTRAPYLSLTSSFSQPETSSILTNIKAGNSGNLGLVIYESTAAKSKKAISYFLIVSLVLLLLGIIFKKK